MLDFRGIRTENSVNFLAVVEEDERGHGFDGERLGEVLALIDVDLNEVNASIGFLVCPVLEPGGDHLARTAPSGEAINNDLAGGQLVVALVVLHGHGSKAKGGDLQQLDHSK